MKHLLTCFLFAAVSALCAQDFYVDNVKGDDNNPGTKEAPFKTLKKATGAMTGGSTLHMVPNEIPYTEPIMVSHWECTHKPGRATPFDGTPEKPTVIDGHGSIIDLRKHIPAQDWTSEGDDVFSITLHNNAGVMVREGYWSGFPIVFIDGNPIPWKKSRAELTEKSYYLCINPGDRKKIPDAKHNQLFVKLPKGKTPADFRIVTPHPILRSCVSITGCANVTVKNLTGIYSHNDAFDNAHNKGFLFENIVGAYCMDQGTSSHCAQGVIRNSHFYMNAGCGIVDCFMSGKPADVKYYDCIIEENVYRGAVDLVGPMDFYFERCIFRNNDGTVRPCKANGTFVDCVFMGRRGTPEKRRWYQNAVFYPNMDSTVTIRNCTFYDCWCAIAYWKQAGNLMTIEKNIFLKCGITHFVENPKSSDYNVYNKDIIVSLAAPDKHTDFANMQKVRQTDLHSTLVDAEDPVVLTKELKGKAGAPLSVLEKALKTEKIPDYYPIKF